MGVVIVAERRRRLRIGLLLSIAVVVVAAYPWGSIVWHAHWSNVGWVPFWSANVRLRDVVANLLLCAPIGVCAGLLYTRGILVAGAITLPLSLGLETMQIYSHGRFPSATDVACNIAGAVACAAMIRRFASSSRNEAHP